MLSYANLISGKTRLQLLKETWQSVLECLVLEDTGTLVKGMSVVQKKDTEKQQQNMSMQKE